MENENDIKIIEKKVREVCCKNGNKYLLGMLEFDNEEYNKLKVLTRRLLSEEGKFLLKYKSMILTIALIKFAECEYKGGKFWREAAKVFDIDEKTIQSEGKLAVENFLKEKHLYFHIGNKNKSYVTTILTHAIICESWFLKFIGFLYDFYVKDLEEDFKDEEVEFLLNYMRNMFLNHIEDEEIQINFKGSKMTIAKQQLPKAFRIAFVQSYELIKPIVKDFLYKINCLNYGKEYKFMGNRFSDLFELYKVNIKIIKNTKKNRVTRGRSKLTRGGYSLIKNKVCLEIGKQIIDFQYLTNDIVLKIYADEEIIFEKKLELIKNRVTFKTSEFKQLMKSFIAKLRYQIISGDIIIYDSKDLLYRDFIIFNQEGEEINSKKIKEESYLIVSDEKQEIDVENGVYSFELYDKYKISTVTFGEDTLIKINNRFIAANSAKLKTEILQNTKIKNIYMYDGNLKLKVFKKEIFINLKTSASDSINDFILNINEKNYSLEEVVENLDITEIYDGNREHVFTFRVKKEYFKYNKSIKFYLREKGDKANILLREEMIIVEDFSCEFDKDFYYEDKYAIIKNLNLKNFSVRDRSYKALYKINLEFIDEFKFNMISSSDGRAYVLAIKVPILKWWIDNSIKYVSSKNYIWWEDAIEKSLYIETDKKIDTLIFTNRNLEKVLRVKPKLKNGIYELELQQIANYKSVDLFSIGFIDSRKSINLTDIYFKNIVRSMEVNYYYDSDMFNGLLIDTEIYGEGNIKIEIINLRNNMIEKTYEYKNKKIMDSNINLCYGEYEAIAYELKSDDFFGEEEKEILFKKKFVVLDLKYLKLKDSLFSAIKCKCGNKIYELKNFYIEDLKCVKNETYQYKAKGFYKIMGGKWKYANRYDPLKLNVKNMKNNIVEIEVVSNLENKLPYNKESMMIGVFSRSGEEIIDKIYLKKIPIEGDGNDN